MLLNQKSDVYYVAQMVGFKPLSVSKLHLIDDDCNEVIATVRGVEGWHGYIAPSELNIIDAEAYSSDKWDNMLKWIEYERAVIL